MHRVKVICFGRLKEPYLREACAEYEKRLSAFCRMETVELPPETLSDTSSPAQIIQALEQEAQLALAKLPKQACLCATCVEGRQLSSEEFGAWLAAQGEIAILIGSSYGLSEMLKARASLKLSISKMTFPHQLVRVMLLEQLYRGFSLAAGRKYHK
jgi:23S rRNA (pseudouridine1915-N3)-methyltransferase